MYKKKYCTPPSGGREWDWSHGGNGGGVQYFFCTYLYLFVLFYIAYSICYMFYIIFYVFL